MCVSCTYAKEFLLAANDIETCNDTREREREEEREKKIIFERNERMCE